MLTKATARRFSFGSAILCTAIVGLLWLALVFDSKKSAETAIDQARLNTNNLAIGFREYISKTVSAIDDLMIAIADEHRNHPGEYRIPDWAEKLPFLRGLAVQVGLIGADGIIRASSLGVTERIDLSDRPHFRHHLEASATQPYISVPLIGRLSKKWSVQFTRRLTRPDGTFDGIVVISVDPFSVWKFFDGISLGPNGAAILVGRDGIVRARSARESQGIGYDLSSTLLIQKLRVAPSGTYVARSPFDGVERVIGYASIQGYPLAVAIGLPIVDILAAVHWQKMVNFAIGGFGTIVIVAGAWLIVRGANRRRRDVMASQAQTILQKEKHKLDAALAAMSQGLMMFDADAKLVFCNRRYLEIFGLSTALVRAGCSFFDLIVHRKSVGTFTGDCKKYCEEIAADIKVGKSSSRDSTLADGRIIHSVNTPMPDGGWVATHEDVTERLRS